MESERPKRALWREDDDPNAITSATAVISPRSRVTLPDSAPLFVSPLRSDDSAPPPAAVPVLRTKQRPVPLSPLTGQKRVSLCEALHNVEKGHKFYWRWADEQLLRKTLLKAATVYAHQVQLRARLAALNETVREREADLEQVNLALAIPGQLHQARLALQERKLRTVRAITQAGESIVAAEHELADPDAPTSLDADDLRILRGCRAMCGGQMWPIPDDVLGHPEAADAEAARGPRREQRERSVSRGRARRSGSGGPGQRSGSPHSPVGSPRMPFLARFVASLGAERAQHTMQAASAALDAATRLNVPRREGSPSSRWVEVEERVKVPLAGSAVFRRLAESTEREEAVPGVAVTKVTLRASTAKGAAGEREAKRARSVSKGRGVRPGKLEPIRNATAVAIESERLKRMEAYLSKEEETALPSRSVATTGATRTVTTRVVTSRKVLSRTK